MEQINALYARQSLDKKDSLSIESQLEFCQYETRGEPYLTYVDRGYSGKNTKRPGFEQMIEDTKAGKIKRIIVYKLDRISRSILDFSNMMELFQSCHVEFISSTEKFDTSTPMGRAMLSICITFAQLERETIQKRIADAYYTKSRRGFYMGGRVPYGFQLKKTTVCGLSSSSFYPIPQEAAQIQLIFNLYYQGFSTPQIVAYFNENAIEKKRGAPFRSSRISEILHNPVYVKADPCVYLYLITHGINPVNQKEEFNGKNALFFYDYSPQQKTAVLAPHEGLIDPHIWLSCQTPHAPSHSWLAGKLICSHCHGTYRFVAQKKNTGYFHCPQKGCVGAGTTLYADTLEKIIWPEMIEYLNLIIPHLQLDKKNWTSQSKGELLSLITDTVQIGDQKLIISWKF